MRILVFSLNYAPEPVGIAVYSTGLAQSLFAMGHEVTVIAGNPYYPDWRQPAGSARGWSWSVEDGVRVIRCPHYVPANPTGLRRVLHLATFALAALPVAVREALHRPALVFAVAPALLAAPVAALAARLGGSRFWLHFQDFEIDAAGATGLLHDGRAMKIARGLERWLLRRADRVSTISPQMVQRLAAKGVAPDRLYELRNWADDAVAWPDPGAVSEYRSKWGFDARRIALYSGNIANKQGLEIVIEAARLLRERTDIGFAICGQGPNRIRLEEMAQGLDNIVFDNLQPRDRMGELLTSAEVHLLPQMADAADLVLPSKLTNILASGRPVVATAAPGTGLSAEVEGCGLVTPPGDAAAMAEAICHIVDNPVMARKLSDAARERARERWSRTAIIAGFERNARMIAG